MKYVFAQCALVGQLWVINYWGLEPFDAPDSQSLLRYTFFFLCGMLIACTILNGVIRALRSGEVG